MNPDERCCESVPDGGRSPRFHRCTRKAVRDGYCLQHHPDSVKARQKESLRRYEEGRKKNPHVLLEAARQEIRILKQGAAQVLTDFWYDHYLHPTLKVCVLCGNTGLVETFNTALVKGGTMAGGTHYCFCPNGRLMREKGTK